MKSVNERDWHLNQNKNKWWVKFTKNSKLWWRLEILIRFFYWQKDIEVEISLILFHFAAPGVILENNLSDRFDNQSE